MKTFRYKALGADGLIHKGITEASSKEDLKIFFHKHRLSPISYSSTLSWPFMKKIKPRRLREMCLHLEQFEKAGIPLIESLTELLKTSAHPYLKKVLKDIITDVNSGFFLSKSLSKYPHLFDAAFVGLIAAGEETGRLAQAFTHLSEHLKWVDDIQAQTFKALRYPLIIFCTLLALFSCFLFFLIPEIVKFMTLSALPLPGSLQTLLYLSTLGKENILLLFFLLTFWIASLIVLFHFYPHWKEELLERVPLIGPLKKSIDLLKFSQVFALTYGNGIDILKALQISEKTLKGGRLLIAIMHTKTFIKEGLSLSSAMEKTQAFPSVMIQMIKMGENTSSLDRSLLSIKESFETMLKS